MPQITYRGNLSSATFPMTVAQAGRSVIVPGPDNYFDRRVDPDSSTKDAGIPQAIYMENVIPTSGGYQSVGYKSLATLTIPAAQQITKIVEILAPLNVGTTAVKHILVFFSNNTYAVATEPSFAWNYFAMPGAIASPGYSAIVSTALVRDVCYIWFQDTHKMATYSVAAGLVDITGTVTGLTLANIQCITGAYNYLIAHDLNTIYWSSTTTPTDFVPSLVSGAGLESPNNLRSYIITLKDNIAGFYIYSANNVLVAVYTGNVRYPWKFKEIPNSGRILFEHHIATGINLSNQFAVTESGQVQNLLSTGADNILPEVSNFLARQSNIDTFDSTTNTFSTFISPVTPIIKKLSFNLKRYLFTSYLGLTGSGYEVYEYAIVWDTQLNRYGKIKIPHTHILDFDSYIVIINSATGVCKKLYFDLSSQLDADKHSGVIVLGKFQYVRSRNLKLEGVEIETVPHINSLSADNFSCILLPSLDGTNFSSPITLTAKSTSGDLRSYYAHKEAKNQSVVLKGGFDINTIQLTFTPGGKF